MKEKYLRFILQLVARVRRKLLVIGFLSSAIDLVFVPRRPD